MARMKLHINWRRVSLLLVWIISLAGVAVLSGFISGKSNDLACNKLEVIIPTAQSFVTRTHIMELVRKHQGDLIGRTLKSIEIHKLEKQIEANPYVASANVYREMDGSVNIKIQPKEAVLRVIGLQGQDFYVDTEGFTMPASLEYAPRVMVANGYISANPENTGIDSLQNETLHDLYRTALFLASDSLWSKQIEQLYVNADSDIELVPRVGEQRIIMGKADSLEHKFRKLALFYKEVIPKVGWGMYQAVNLKFANQLVCEKADSIWKKEQNH